MLKKGRQKGHFLKNRRQSLDTFWWSSNIFSLCMQHFQIQARQSEPNLLTSSLIQVLFLIIWIGEPSSLLIYLKTTLSNSSLFNTDDVRFSKVVLDRTNLIFTKASTCQARVLVKMKLIMFTALRYYSTCRVLDCRIAQSRSQSNQLDLIAIDNPKSKLGLNQCCQNIFTSENQN